MKLLILVGIILALSGISLAALKDPICGQEPAKQGRDNPPRNCMARMPRFSYYPDKNVCQKWIYGGCGANENNFEKIENCEAKCKT